MAAGCAGVAARLESPPALPDPDDREGWHARIAMMDGLMVLVFSGRVDHGLVDVTEHDIGGVHVFEITPRRGDRADAPVSSTSTAARWWVAVARRAG